MNTDQAEAVNAIMQLTEAECAELIDLLKQILTKEKAAELERLQSLAQRAADESEGSR